MLKITDIVLKQLKNQKNAIRLVSISKSVMALEFENIFEFSQSIFPNKQGLKYFRIIIANSLEFKTAVNNLQVDDYIYFWVNTIADNLQSIVLVINRNQKTHASYILQHTGRQGLEFYE